MKNANVGKLITAICLALVLFLVPSVAGAMPAKRSTTNYLQIPYGNNPYQVSDVYPAPAPNAPLVVLVHGGGWHSTVGPQLPTEAADLQAAGFTVVSVNYDNIPSTGAFPVEVDDVVAATQWAIANATTYNGNPNDVVLIGGSAGGQLVGMASEALPGRIKGVVTLSGLFDFPLVDHDVNRGTLHNYVSSVAAKALACNFKKGTCGPATEGLWSPAEQLTPANGTTWLIFNGSKELMPLDQADSMNGALTTNGCAVTETVVATPEHSFAYWSKVSGTIKTFVATR